MLDSNAGRAKTRPLLLLTVLFCVVPSVFSTRGQRVRSSPDIPFTQFSCTDRPPGYYADVETGCQVYHMCTEGGNQFSYRCPNTTLFQQRMLICAHSYQVNCNRSDQYYSNNLLIGQRDKHFVNDDPIFFSKEKELKTLQNPETLQNLGQASRKDSSRQAKSHSNTDNVSNRVFQNTLKRDEQPQAGFVSRTTQFSNSFPTTSRPTQFVNSFPTPKPQFFNSFSSTSKPTQFINSFSTSKPQFFNSFSSTSKPTTQFANSFSTSNSQFFNSFSTSTSPVNNDRTPEDLSSLPLAGSVLPGGLKSFQFSKPPRNSQTFQTTVSNFQPINFRAPTTNSPGFVTQKNNQPTFFSSPSSTPNSIDRVNLFATTKSPISFSPKFSSENSFKLQPSGFSKPTVNSFAQDSSSPPSFEFLPPSNEGQPDLMVASQENAVESRRSNTLPPNNDEEFVGVAIPETDVKAVIEQTRNGSSPDDKFNSFLKRFNPYEEAPKPTGTATTEESDKSFHTFINRFVPDDRPLEGQLVTGYNLEEQPGDHVFVDRFVLTPEELQLDKNRQQVDRLHNLLPPSDHLTINFPNFDLVPPAGEDSDDSESNKIELQFQDPRSSFFIPSGDGSDFSKADAAPIVVTIPLHSNQRSSQMLFRRKESEDSCSKCHPSFIINKETCSPCVIIR